VQRQLLVLENQGGAKFFGEPSLDIEDLMRTDRDGRGVINMLAADKLMENPLDVPDKVLAQLGNRVQHALRAFTPRDQKAVRAAAETFRPNPKLDTVRVITELGTGEALVSCLEGKGSPAMVQRTMIRPPSARLGPLSAAERQAVIAKSPLRGRYEQTIDPESASEILQRRVQDAAAAAEQEAAEQETAERPTSGGLGGVLGGILGGGGGRSRRMSTTEVVVKQVARSVASQVGTQIGKALIRGVLGSLGGKR
jgi:hypothetical protein